MNTDAAGGKSQGIRTLVLSVMMSTLIAVMVFAVFSLAFVYPQMQIQTLQLIAQQKQIDAMNERLGQLEEAQASAEAVSAAAAQRALPTAAAAPAPAPGPAK